MATVRLLADDDEPSPMRGLNDVHAVRQTEFVNNFWRALAHDPGTLKRMWKCIKQVMGPRALDPMIKEMLYTAVSIAHGRNYCIHSHTAAARAKVTTEANTPNW